MIKIKYLLSLLLFSLIIAQDKMDEPPKFSDFQILAREELLSNLSSTAPRLEFIVNADIETSLAEGIISSNLFVSTNGQSSWESTNNLSFLGTYGYEDTWEGLVNTNGGNSSNWYISALINSAVLEQNFGNITVSQSPINNFNNWCNTFIDIHLNLRTTCLRDKQTATTGRISKFIKSCFVKFKKL